MTETESRQANLVPDFSGKSIGIIGLGMHGSWTALLVAQLGVGSLVLWDMDTVSLGNFSNQLHLLIYRGNPKTYSTVNLLNQMVLKIPSLVLREKFDETPTSLADVRHLDALICCADSFEVRKVAALAACRMKVGLFIESRSAMHTAFIHTFNPTKAKTDVYLSTCFPQEVENVNCGDTGTAAMGALVGAEIAASLIHSRCGEAPELTPEEKTISLGFGIQCKMVVFDKDLQEGLTTIDAEEA